MIVPKAKVKHKGKEGEADPSLSESSDSDTWSRMEDERSVRSGDTSTQSSEEESEEERAPRPSIAEDKALAQEEARRGAEGPSNPDGSQEI